MLRAAAFETKRVLSKAGKPVDRREWYANTFTVDAFYNASANHTVIPAGILQPPFFGANRSIAANLGGIGMVIGHELTHAFDDQGAQFDGDGNLTNWWQPDDKAKFEAKGTCVADMYSSFEALPKQFVNGELTLGENIADLGGVKMAFYAYRDLRNGADETYVAEGFNEDQQFFLAVAQAWCSHDREAEAVPGVKLDGKLTMGENIADMGGVKLAFFAYRALTRDQKEAVADGFTEDQQFFLSLGQIWCSKQHDEYARMAAQIDPHSPPRWRVNGPLRNLPEFSRAFSCAPGTPMNPENKCGVW